MLPPDAPVFDCLIQTRELCGFTAAASGEITRILNALTLPVAGVLSALESKVVRLRFGFGGERCHTLKQVGTLFGYTRENIRQVQKKALPKLRTALTAKTRLRDGTVPSLLDD